MDRRQRAWADIYDLLAAGWRVGPGLRHPSTGRWTLIARSPKYSGRQRAPAAVSGQGEDELAARSDLAIRLRELRDVERRMAIEERARAAFLQGAEEQSRATLGRPLTQAELKRVLQRFR
jgi:hypothetical protein